METDKAIYFFGYNGDYGFLSNFYPITFTVYDITFNCSEQYYMFWKAIIFDCNNIKLIKNILKETNPKKIKAYGRSVKNFDENIWQIYRYQIMLDALKEKFKNPELKQKLLKTGNKHLYEASPYDKIWGIGFGVKDLNKVSKDKFGQNLLGQALMEVRKMYN